MNILVTGGCGVMGSALVKELAARGHTVCALTLPGDPCTDRVKGITRILYGDIAQPSTLSGCCQGIDMVFHCAAVIIAPPDQYQRINVQGTAAILDQAQLSGVRHFVHISSASVVYPQPTPYSHSKRDAEKLVRDSPFPWTIIRPTLVYDAGSGGQEFDQFLVYLRRFPVVPFIGSGSAIKRPVYLGDIIEGLVQLVDKEVSFGKTYNFSGSEAISMLDFARLCMLLDSGFCRPLIHLPVSLCRLLAWFAERLIKNPPLRWPVIAGVIQDADLDPSPAMTDTGFTPHGVSSMLPRCFPRTYK